MNSASSTGIIESACERHMSKFSGLHQQARTLASKKKYGKALELYLQLAKKQPKDPRWPHQQAEMQRRLGETHCAVAAYSRAAVLYAEQGFGAKSIALCKIILGIDPDHADTQQILAEVISESPQLKPKADALRQQAVGSRQPSAETIAEPPPKGGAERPPKGAAGDAGDGPTWQLGNESASYDVADALAAAVPDLEELPYERARETAPELALKESITGSGAYDDMHAALDDVAEDLDVNELEFVEESDEITNPGAITQRLQGDASLTDLSLAEVFGGVSLAEAGLRTFRINLGSNQQVGSRNKCTTITPGVDQLPDTPLFSWLDRQALQWLIQRVDVRLYRQGEAIVRQGEFGGDMFVLAEGIAYAYDDSGPRRLLSNLPAGSFFGEISLLSGEVRTATVEAAADVIVIRISREMVCELVRRHPQVLSVMLRFGRDRLLNTQFTRSTMAGDFPLLERARIAEYFQLVEAVNDTQLVSQGELADAMYLVLAGTLSVVHDPERPPSAGGKALQSELVSGDFFGAYSLLTAQPAYSSIIARTKCWLLCLDRPTFGFLVAAFPRILKLLSEMAQTRRTLPGLPSRSFHLT